MPITYVNYARLVNLGNYENERFQAGVTLAEGQTPESGMEEARAFVDAQNAGLVRARKRLDELEQLERKYERLESDISDRKRTLEGLNQVRDNLVGLLAQHGVHVDLPRWGGGGVVATLAAPEPEAEAGASTEMPDDRYEDDDGDHEDDDGDDGDDGDD